MAQLEIMSCSGLSEVLIRRRVQNASNARIVEESHVSWTIGLAPQQISFLL